MGVGVVQCGVDEELPQPAVVELFNTASQEGVTAEVLDGFRVPCLPPPPPPSHEGEPTVEPNDRQSEEREGAQDRRENPARKCWDGMACHYQSKGFEVIKVLTTTGLVSVKMRYLRCTTHKKALTLSRFFVHAAVYKIDVSRLAFSHFIVRQGEVFLTVKLMLFLVLQYSDGKCAVKTQSSAKSAFNIDVDTRVILKVVRGAMRVHAPVGPMFIAPIPARLALRFDVTYNIMSNVTAEHNGRHEQVAGGVGSVLNDNLEVILCDHVINESLPEIGRLLTRAKAIVAARYQSSGIPRSERELVFYTDVPHLQERFVRELFGSTFGHIFVVGDLWHKLRTGFGRLPSSHPDKPLSPSSGVSVAA
jgi:hypothetical protein